MFIIIELCIVCSCVIAFVHQIMSYKLLAVHHRDRLVNDSSVIANEFNNLFVSIGSELTRNIYCTVNPLPLVNDSTNSIVVSNITTTDVNNVITDLNNSSPGWIIISY